MNSTTPDWSQQSQRLYNQLKQWPALTVFELPELMTIAAGEGHQYVASLSKRISEVRKRLNREGYTLKLCKNQMVEGQRRTAYRVEVMP